MCVMTANFFPSSTALRDVENIRSAEIIESMGPSVV